MPSRARFTLRRAAGVTAALVLAAALVAPAARAQSPIDPVLERPPLPSEVFSAQFGGASYALAVDGPRALLGVGPRVHLLDVDGESLRRVGETPVLEGLVRAVAFDGDLAFVGLAQSGGLIVFDLAAPASPRELGRAATRGEVRNLVVTPDVVYAAVFGGLRVYRRPTPATLEEVAVELPFRGVIAAALDGDTLYVLEPTVGLHAVSVADPLAPAPVAGAVLPLPDMAPDANGDLRLIGDTLYVAADRQVYVLDLAERRAPRVVSALPAQGTIVDLDVRGDRLAVAEMEAGAAVYDISAPRAPQLLARHPTVQGISSVAWTGDGRLLSTDWLSGLARRQLAAGALAAPDASYGATTFVDGAAPLGEGRLAVSAALARLMTLAPAPGGDPSMLDLVASVDLPAGVRTTHVLAFPERVAVLGPNGGLWLFGLGGGVVDAPAGSLALNAHGGAVLADGRALAIAGGGGGVHTVALDADGMRRLATVPTDLFAGGVAAAGDLLAVADRTAGLRLVDVSDPAQPSIVSDTPAVGPAMDVALVGRDAFLVTQNGALEAFDLADPARPTSRGAVSLGGGALRVVAAGTVLYALVDEHTVVPVDVGDPGAPVVGAPYALPERIGDLAVDGQRVLVTAGKYGLLIGELPVRPRTDGIGDAFDPVADAPGAAAMATSSAAATATAARAPEEAAPRSAATSEEGPGRPRPSGGPIAVAAAAATVLALVALLALRAALRRREEGGG